MDEGTAFIDFYAVLDVDPACDTTALEKAYKDRARLFHPDHAATADIGRFHAVAEAYAMLKDPAKRARFDELRRAAIGEDVASANVADGPGVDERAALHDAEVHKRILLRLYSQRRERADAPGIIGYYVQQMLDCSDRNFEFHVWYLKSKGLIESLEDSSLAITIAGVDHVIAMSRAAAESPRISHRPEPGTTP